LQVVYSVGQVIDKLIFGHLEDIFCIGVRGKQIEESVLLVVFYD
jgi:hypothetical protein